MGTDTDHHFIERMRWDQVARRIGDGAVAILPIGAAAKQHGFHLPLNTDRIQAEWLAGRMAEKIDALIWPTVTYGHYPAFVEYAGSSSLSISTFEALVREVAGQILGSGCKKLLVLNTGISTLAPVEMSPSITQSAPVTRTAEARLEEADLILESCALCPVTSIQESPPPSPVTTSSRVTSFPDTRIAKASPA
jgi:hypothetical protein